MNNKIIHYCWFGGGEKGELISRCMKTWKKYLPDYEIREWTDKDVENIDNDYVREAFQNEKWAFVSDYMRLYALYEFGGIYLDTDVEIRKNIDEFLDLDFFSCFEYREKSSECFPISALMGAQKGERIIGDLLDIYSNKRFVKDDGSFDMTPNTVLISKYLEDEFGIKPPYNKNEQLELKGNSVIFPYYYFCTDVDDKAYAVHHFSGSWKKKSWRLFRNDSFELFVAKNSYLRNVSSNRVKFKFKIFRNRNLVLVRR